MYILRRIAVLCLVGTVTAGAQSSGQLFSDQVLSDHKDECSYYGPKHKKYVNAGLMGEAIRRSRGLSPSGQLTQEVTDRLAVFRARSASVQPLAAATPSSYTNTIDKYFFAALNEAKVAPAEKTTDWEFIRRASLDLTGRVPTTDRVLQFVNDPSPDKRASLVDELIAKPEWTDKWTMFFGDLFKNDSSNTQITRFANGRDAFYRWIHDSLAANKHYDQIAKELISARGASTFDQGELNWVVGSRMTGGPNQDTWDQQAANVAETFLGLGNTTCLMCHNGRGHLDNLNLWAKGVTRLQAEQLSAFFAQAIPVQVRPDPVANKNFYYWTLIPDAKKYPGTYSLNTTNGNRPNRVPVGTMKTLTPVYLFSGAAPKAGEDYQAFLANAVVSDVQFARAAVNYLWKEFFGRGIVEPANQFDLARLDPDNPPPDPWTLQPSNPRLLNALAQDFIASRFDLQALMKGIVNSEAYQLSSRYDNSKWTPEMEQLFARHLVRRLWAEEIHDNVVQTSNVMPKYTINDYGTTGWAMQLPETKSLPGGSVGNFLDSFLRGNRDDQDRSGESSVLQALNLMNDPFVVSRVKATGKDATASLLMQNINKADDQLVTNLYLTVLSRYPTNDEKNAAMTKLKSGNRTQQAEDFLWSLYNKVDFVFNY
jgi:hypothetical protein